MEDEVLHDSLYGDAPAADSGAAPSTPTAVTTETTAEPVTTDPEATVTPTTTTETAGEEGQTGEQTTDETVGGTTSKATEGLQATVVAERAKRQAAELENAHLRGVQEGRTASQPVPEPEPEADFWEDPEGWTRKQIANARAQDQSERFDTSVANAMAKYPDYKEMETELAVMAKSDPNIGAQLGRQLDPAEWGAQKVIARRAADKAAAEATTFDPVKEREKIRAELVVELGADGDTGKKPPASVAQIPTSNAAATGGGATATGGEGITDEKLLEAAFA